MMNYIQKLQAENQALRQALASWNDGLSDVMRYLQSSKFWEDTTVQVSDAMMRLTEARSRMSDVLVNAQVEIEGVA